MSRTPRAKHWKGVTGRLIILKETSLKERMGYAASRETCGGYPLKAEAVDLWHSLHVLMTQEGFRSTVSYQTENRHASAGRDQSFMMSAKCKKPERKPFRHTCLVDRDCATNPLLTGDSDGQDSPCLQLLWNPGKRERSSSQGALSYLLPGAKQPTCNMNIWGHGEEGNTKIRVGDPWGQNQAKQGYCEGSQVSDGATDEYRYKNQRMLCDHEDLFRFDKDQALLLNTCGEQVKKCVSWQDNSSQLFLTGK